MKNSTTSERLKEIMQKKGLKQVDILEAAKPYCVKYGIKLGRNDLSQYISGKVNPSQNKLTILGLALNVSEVWLMGYDVPIERDFKNFDNVLPLPELVKMTFGAKLKNIRLSMKMSQDEFAKKLNTTKQVISRYETEQRTPKISIAQEYADILGLPLSDLIDNSVNFLSASNIIPLPETVDIPLLGNIACGEPIFAEENLDGYVKVPSNCSADLALRCKGDSMIGARIMDGDIVLIRQQPDVEDGEIAAVLIDNEATLKRVYKMPERLILRPENPAYKAINIYGEELNNIKIIGKAVYFISGIK